MVRGEECYTKYTASTTCYSSVRPLPEYISIARKIRRSRGFESSMGGEHANFGRAAVLIPMDEDRLDRVRNRSEGSSVA